MHPSSRGQGKAFAWLEAHKEYPHKEWCLVWPFYRNRHGQGALGYQGKNYWAHRLMCTMVHGEPEEAIRRLVEQALDSPPKKKA